MNTHATSEATQRFTQSKDLVFKPRILGKTRLHVSPFGFGSYRVDDRTKTHVKALHYALEKGCNLIDTSSNYTDGHSEIMVGSVLKEQIAAGKIQREDIVLVTKAGYIQGSNQVLAKERKAQGKPFGDVVEISEDLWHCISPDFLESQIALSLERLQVETLDVFLLHNPEYFLKKTPDPQVYYARIKKAFEFLEEQVKSGLISHYGVSSNTFPESSGSPEFTSLETLISLAERVSAAHHFSVIQFPFNFFESGALLEKNNSGKTVLELSRDKNLGTLANRPLNAFVSNRLVRLASFPLAADDQLDEKLKTAFEESLSVEKEYPLTSEETPFMVGHILLQHKDKIEDMTVWKEIFSYQVNPLLQRSFKILATHPDIVEWTKLYREKSVQLIEVFTQWMETQSARKSQDVLEWLTPFFENVPPTTTLSQLALASYADLAIDCTLVGMREMKYVEDVFSAPKLKFKNSSQEVFTKIKQLMK